MSDSEIQTTFIPMVTSELFENSYKIGIETRWRWLVHEQSVCSQSYEFNLSESWII